MPYGLLIFQERNGFTLNDAGVVMGIGSNDRRQASAPGGVAVVIYWKREMIHGKLFFLYSLHEVSDDAYEIMEQFKAIQEGWELLPLA